MSEQKETPQNPCKSAYIFAQYHKSIGGTRPGCYHGHDDDHPDQNFARAVPRGKEVECSVISGEEFKRLRLEKGLSQNDLSNAAGLGGQSVVSNIERGLAPGPETERRMREALGLVVQGPVTSDD